METLANACWWVMNGARAQQAHSLVPACDAPTALVHAPTGSYNCWTVETNLAPGDGDRRWVPW